jgi:lysophospholipase L1-like esterase
MTRRRAALLIATSAFALGAAIWAGIWHRAGRDDPYRYEQKFRAIENRPREDRPTGAVVLTGSSYIEKWTTSASDLAPLTTVNIGVGGTRARDHTTHLQRMLPGLAPTAVVVYVGSNDINGARFHSKSAAETVPLVLEYLAAVREALPSARIYYVAITEAPSRRRVRGDIRSANRELATAAKKTGLFTFIDTAPALLSPDGSIDESLFGADRLHLNEKGYQKFALAVRDGLAPEFENSQQMP